MIEITVSPTGETTVQTKGFTGSVCFQASQWLEHALGLVTQQQKTAEFYQSASQEQRIEQS